MRPYALAASLLVLFFVFAQQPAKAAKPTVAEAQAFMDKVETELKRR